MGNFNQCFNFLVFLLFFQTARCNSQNITYTLEAAYNNFKSTLWGNISSNCRNQGRELFHQITHLEPWTLTMLDASAKIPSGIMVGNGMIMHGSYDECLSVKVQPKDNITSPIRGKYCYITLEIAVPEKQKWLETYQKFEDFAKEFKLEIPEKLPIWTVAICVPNGCTNADMQSILDAGNSMIPNVSKFHLGNCFEDEKTALDTPAIVVITIWTIIASILLVATAYDMTSQAILWWKSMALLSNKSSSTEQLSTGQNNNVFARFLVTISIYTNAKKLFSMKETSDKLSFLDGMRFLSIAWIVLGHTRFFIPLTSDSNSETTVPSNKYTGELLDNISLAVDTFLFMSGMLLTYVKFRELRKTNGRINPIKFYMHRYWRLLPPVAMLLAWEATLSESFLKHPPLTNYATDTNSCKQDWWLLILFMNNGIYSQPSCLPHTWYLSVDFQLFALSPLVLYPLYKRPKIGYCIMAIFTAASIIASGIVHHKAKNFIYDFMHAYYKMYSRIPSYIVGMLVGYIIQKPDFKIQMKPITVCCCWVLVSAMNLSICVFGISGSNTDQSKVFGPSSNLKICYLTLAPIAWCVGLAWITFACANGYAGIVKNILSWNFWKPLSKLSYAIYLLHIVVLLEFANSRQHKFHYDGIYYAFMFFALLIMSILVAIPFALAFEFPFVALQKFQFRNKNKEENLRRLNASLPKLDADLVCIKTSKSEDCEDNINSK